MNYEEAIEFIHSTYKFGSKLGLQNITKLMDLLGNPQDSYKIIHVAGTNGKGSTCNLINEVLMSSGYKTGLFISPYLEVFTERIQINKKHIDKNSLSNITSLVRDKINIMVSEGYNHPTEFEVVTAIGLKYFEEQNIDFLVLEVGLGGRFDATNIVKSPLLSVITSISYDHTEYLGNTLEEIAFEKAGIIKENSNVVVYPNDESITNVIRDVAQEKNTKIYETNISNIKKIKSDFTGQWFEYLKNDIFTLPEIKLSFLGRHQLLNALTALRALEVIKNEGFEIKEESIVKAFKNVKFPGRFEIISENPIIVLDGAHNINGIEYFSKAVKEYFKDEKIILFLGMLKDKNPQDVLKYLVPLSKEIYTLTPNNPRAMKATDLADLIKNNYNIKVSSIENYKDIIAITEKAHKDDFIAFAGSLYMIGEVRTLINKSNL